MNAETVAFWYNVEYSYLEEYYLRETTATSTQVNDWQPWFVPAAVICHPQVIKEESCNEQFTVR
ncbi:MAG: hypothetical protein J6R39_02610, partial [Oscillospiraceae bacterium]|nr:hypothetical protein [Oscillospiraceae bacterium]